ncbi:MAG: bifunctional 5,10-methylenetetrahydrofolate dehydrogenase/5,10-methenyltetrahydrofolate cyclohydrolase [Nitrososphaerota archaeon]
MAVIMRGKPLLLKTREEVRRRVERLKEMGITPGLAAILTEDDPTSKLYVSKKVKDCSKCGIYSEVWEVYRERPEVRERELMRLISTLNSRHDVSGILVQLPLPNYIDVHKVLEVVDPNKDVDGLTPTNRGRWMGRYDPERDLLPCTAIGIMELLDHYGVDVAGSLVAVVGRSDLVGKPLFKLLLDRNATPVLIHTRTRESRKIIRMADVVICAVGRPPEIYGETGFRLTGDMIRDGAVVINVGIRRTPEGSVFYDVDLESVLEKASFVTENEAVGYMTRARLLKNTVIAAERFARQLTERGLVRSGVVA